MKAPSRPSFLSLAFVACVVGCIWPNQAGAQNLVTNGSFESGAWGGTESFVDSNNATTLMYWNNLVSNWTPNSGSTWVQDAVRAPDGNRMVWLGAPASGAETYISQPISTVSAGGGLQGNQTYHLSLGYDFFDRSDPEGMMAMESTINIYYVLGTYMFMGDPGNPMLMDDSFTRTALFTDSGMTDAWSTGASMDWQTASINFTTPSLTGYDYLRIYISAPQDTPSSPSMGVIIDNVSLNLATVPEPGSLLLATLGAMLLARCRRAAA